ncbi:DUF7261 family protein [Halovivax cerinus]|uniref:Archaeal flagellin-like protein n=1 Tax=Halovivax cerinus TaxID=1487865 RepID=A0ABD5NKC4_9EURY|nr:hypothetical protein [Halovivax cerinus]
MVTEDTRVDRGQLLLVGAISLAFILLGVVMVFNSVQYTETINSGSATDDVQEIRTVESEIRTGLQVLDNRGEISTDSDVEEYIADYYAQEKTRQRPVHITVESANAGTDTVTIRYTTEDITVTHEVNW